MNTGIRVVLYAISVSLSTVHRDCISSDDARAFQPGVHLHRLLFGPYLPGNAPLVAVPICIPQIGPRV